MKEIKDIFTLEYHPKLITVMAKSTVAGSFASNIIVSIVSIIILYAFLPHILIYIWLFSHFILFGLRIFVSNKLLYFLEKSYDKKKVQHYFLFSLGITSLTAILYTVLIWFVYIYSIPDLYIFLITTLIIVLAASSISTFGNVIISFILFVFFTVTPLILLALSQNKEVFLILAFILLFYMLLHFLFGYRQYFMLRNSIFLEDTFKSIYDKSTDGVMLIKDHRLFDCNDATIKMFDYMTKEEFLNTNLTKMMPKYQPDGRNSMIKMLDMLNIALNNGTNNFEWVHKKSDGTLFWTEIVLTKIMLNAEELVHGTWRDIEDRKKLEIAKESANKEIEALNKSLVQRVTEEVEKNREKDKQLLQQSRMAQMGEMIAMIAHQWRQPLSAISATSISIELKAKMGRLDNETAEKKAHEISKFSQHLSNTIDDFRNFFKPNKEKEEISFEKAMESSLKIVQTELESKNILVHTDCQCQKNLFIYVNELHQVLLNLIKNAEDALVEKETKNPIITINCYSNEHEAVLEVGDNAGGIPKEIIDKIFDPYFSTKKGREGTGLGLYMSKTIIEDHCGGILSVYNDENGAVFKIVLSKIDIGT